MSIWDRFKRNKQGNISTDHSDIFGKPIAEYDSSLYAFVDVEVGFKDKKIHDIGALRFDDAIYHDSSKSELFVFLANVDYLCGHNIIHHDSKYLFGEERHRWILVDTLYLSPLLFPERPYHRLVKDYKLLTEQMNNPVNDCEKAKILLFDEISRWNSLSLEKQLIFASLLRDKPEFYGFLQMVNAPNTNDNLSQLIFNEYREKICHHADLNSLVEQYPYELAYALALIDTTDHRSITPGWVLYNFPDVEHVVTTLRQTTCDDGCPYCNQQLNLLHNLKSFFGYNQFRTFEGENLQERAAQAAVNGKSLLAIFPTGGGKSLTFQLPALMAGRAVHGLTVVISPLQSLMKDQVDNLVDRGITDAVTINGLLDPLTRAHAIQRVEDGEASILYISPEMLRSKTIEKILSVRHVVRFVIDEAHCFSSWGQDFRVDYLYIGKFIREYQKRKRYHRPIPISCFTATAKQKVIQDIRDYFKQQLDLDLELFASTATRTNLRYSVIHVDTDDDKYVKLRSLIAESPCPTIVYVSRTKRTKELASRLTRDGFKALPFNGKMDSDEKITNQEAFMTDQVSIIVATSAFGMGVDKKDVGLVVHYDISDSLENYVQEAGRAGRDPHLSARCFVLYSDNDLDKHFILLNQTKLSISEIQQVWKAVKDFTKHRNRFCCSALEIARQAGWDDSVSDIETRVRTAISALEQSGYVERGNNVPHVYATGITIKNMDEARKRITESALFESNEIENAIRIISRLISHKHIAKAQNSEAESRIDYLADILGMTKAEVVSAVERMRQEGILADSRDISAYLYDGSNSKRASSIMLERFARLEQFILRNIPDESLQISSKQLNENAMQNGITSSKEKDVRTLLYFLTVKGYIRKKEDSTSQYLSIERQADMDKTISRFEKRLEISRLAIEWLYNLASDLTNDSDKKNAVNFSIIELLNYINSSRQSIFGGLSDVQIEDVEESLLYLSRIGAMKLEGGFLVIYSAMDITRLKDTKLRYKIDDYRLLNEFYKQKIQQVHIVGEYANLMVKDYDAALQNVQDYFQMDYKRFIAKYFKGTRVEEIQLNVTPKKYEKYFGNLSGPQKEIISDKESRCIVVAAGPGSGKTRLLVHKLASLLQLEDVKHEQLLMLTFSRAAATEFKQRLIDLIGNAAHFVEIKTFHSYCFDLMGRIGNLEDADNIVAHAANMINNGEVEPSKIGKTVLVIDEAQDMSAEEYELVRALMKNNEDMRIIAVGDDDQNIYEFRGSNSKYLYQLSQTAGSKFYEMVENYRSSKSVVNFANRFVSAITKRIKSKPIISMSNDDGWVEVTHHKSNQMYLPIIEAIAKNNSNSSTCVLTFTNEEAVTLVALLHRKGIRSKLIQSIEGFRFYNLAETRYLLKQVSKNTITPLIPENVWIQAKQATLEKYRNSKSIEYIKRFIDLFEQTNQTKYLSDLDAFAFESSIEDFIDTTGTGIVVSTVHKAKGREFDDVYMMLSDRSRINDELRRCLYVGITRAKKRLFIHTNGDYFDHIHTDKFIVDQQEYPRPEEVVLQLSHKDVYLGLFKDADIRQTILSLRAGDELRYSNHYLFEPNKNMAIAKLSTRMQEKLAEWENKGYEVTSASIRFIVAWKPADAERDEREYAVLLPDLCLTLSSDKSKSNSEGTDSQQIPPPT